MSFPLSLLPLELALEILRLAASPYIQRHDPPPAQIYQSTIALALVSHNVREVIMPHFLNTIIFSTQSSIHLFIRTLEQQQYFAMARSRLHLDYTKLVRRIWSTQYGQPLVESTDYPEDYRLLSAIFQNAQSIGFNCDSQHLLYEVLGDTQSLGHPLPRWNCKRVTLAGEGLRWNPLTNTTAGYAFLKNLTHLTIWSPTNDTFSPPNAPGSVPNWVQRVPFELMPNLIHFAFPLVHFPGSFKITIVVYTHPMDPYLPNKTSTAFRQWATADSLESGSLHEIDVGYPAHGKAIPDISWEIAYLQGVNDMWRKS